MGYCDKGYPNKTRRVLRCGGFCKPDMSSWETKEVSGINDTKHKMPSLKSASPSANKRQAVTIRHGKDPEVQAVSIRATKHGVAPGDDVTVRPPTGKSDVRMAKRKSKSMTTRSTMTNEDDYTVVHTNTPCTTPTSSVRDGPHAMDDDGVDDVIAHKMVGWKMTPRVHFPPPNTIVATSSLRTSEARILKNLPQDDGKEFLKVNKIDPPFIHRPDRTLVVHQTLPMPLEPVKAWPGYGGNVYFQPFRIDSKPIADRSFSPKLQASVRSRSQATSRMEFSTPDVYSLSKMGSPVNCPSPSVPSTRRGMTAGTHSVGISSKHAPTETDGGEQHYRQMSHLDKNYVLGLPTNSTLNEDWAWISGMESLGSLKIGDPIYNVQRQSTKETFTRHTVVEKVPHNFVFHPTERKKPRMRPSPLAIKRYSVKHGIPEWALKQFIDRYYRDNQGIVRLPVIPLKVKGKGVPSDAKKRPTSNVAAL